MREGHTKRLHRLESISFRGMVLAVALNFLPSSYCAQAASFMPPPQIPESEMREAEEVLRADDSPRLFIREFRVQGNTVLGQQAVEKAVYPFLGPGREYADVDRARAALEQAYRDEGYQTVTVEVPPQQAKRGIIYLNVVEGKVDRLRIKGSRYFDLGEIREGAASMREDQIPDFDEVMSDIVALNQHPKAIFLISGTGTEQIKTKLDPKLIKGEFDNLQTAVNQAFQFAQSQDTILFSPAFTSFGMFKNEFDRGDQFNSIVKQLKQHETKTTPAKKT